VGHAAPAQADEGRCHRHAAADRQHPTARYFLLIAPLDFVLAAHRSCLLCRSTVHTLLTPSNAGSPRKGRIIPRGHLASSRTRLSPFLLDLPVQSDVPPLPPSHRHPRAQSSWCVECSAPRRDATTALRRACPLPGIGSGSSGMRRAPRRGLSRAGLGPKSR
jgi:hypothetical protein